MNILIDISHPAHVHYFRNLVQELRIHHNVTVTCRDHAMVIRLLQEYNIAFTVVGRKGRSLFAKAKRQILAAKRIRDMIKLKKIDIAINGAAIHASIRTNAKSILFDDDDQAPQPLTAKFVTPFADVVISPDALAFEKLPKAVYYPGYHELAYLHPNRYMPNPAVIRKYGLNEGDDYFILRFNAFKAHHDINEGGMSMKQKSELVSLLESKGKVFITTEANIDPEFEKYKLPIPPHEIHDFLYYAKMFVSDSQTMSSEAAVLGVPSFRCNSFAGRLAVLEEEEKKYGLTYGFHPRQFDWMMARIKETLDIPNVREQWAIKRSKLLEDKIDVTAFWVWFIENYPKSIDLAKEEALIITSFDNEDLYEIDSFGSRCMP